MGWFAWTYLPIYHLRAPVPGASGTLFTGNGGNMKWVEICSPALLVCQADLEKYSPASHTSRDQSAGAPSTCIMQHLGAPNETAAAPVAGWLAGWLYSGRHLATLVCPSSLGTTESRLYHQHALPSALAV